MSSEQKKLQPCLSLKENSKATPQFPATIFLPGLDSSHAGKEENRKDKEIMYHKNACVCRKQGMLLFSWCLIKWKKKGRNEKYTTTQLNALHSTLKYGQSGNRANKLDIEFATSLHSFHG